MRNQIRTAAAIIRVAPGDTSITNALATCLEAKCVARVFVVDQARGKEAYAAETMLEKLKGANVDVSFVAEENDALYQRMHSEQVMLEVPPGLFATREHVRRLMETADKGRASYKCFATSPVYSRYAGQSFSLAEGLLIVFHVMWSLPSIPYGGRLYRDTYLRVTVLNKEMNTVSLPIIAFGHGERAPFVHGMGGVQLRPPPGWSGMDTLLYLIDRERFTFNIWLLMLIATFALGFPYQVLVTVGPRETLRHAVLSSAGIVRHVACSAFHLYYGSKYFSGHAFPVTLLYALLAPFAMPLVFLLAIYAKTIWRGYGGEAPTLVFPPITSIPLFKDFVAGRLGREGFDVNDSNDNDDSGSINNYVQAPVVAEPRGISK